MAFEPNAGGLGNRSWQRHNCGTEGAFYSEAGDSSAFMVDASRGGFKLRFEKVDVAMRALLPLPRDIMVTDAAGLVFPATVIWAKDGLAGCRFYAHISLDDVVNLTRGRFSLTAMKTAPQDQAGGDAAGPSN